MDIFFKGTLFVTRQLSFVTTESCYDAGEIQLVNF